MNDYRPRAGDTVKVIINDARIASVNENGWINFRSSSNSFSLDFPAHDVELIKREVRPQAGEIWNHPDEGLLYVLWGGSLAAGVELFAFKDYGKVVLAVEALDWSNAVQRNPVDMSTAL